MFFSPKQGLARIKAVYTLTYIFCSNFNSCSKRLCEGKGPSLRKDDSCDSTLATYNELFIDAPKVVTVLYIVQCTIGWVNLYKKFELKYIQFVVN